MNRIEKALKLIKKLNADGLLITSEENCRYFTNSNVAEGMVFITPDRSYHLVDSRYFEAACRFSKENSLEVCLVKERFSDVIYELAGKQNIKAIAYEDSNLTVEKHKAFTDKIKCDFVPTGSALEEIRAVKTNQEVKFIEQAQDIAEKAFEQMLNYIKEGESEKHLAAELNFLMAKYGSERPSFDTILISGVNTSLPHGVPSDKTIKKGEFITMDFGAVVCGYHSDMTRTVALSHVTDEMQEVYNTVLKAQLAAIEKIQKGAMCDYLHSIAMDVIEKAGYGEFFTHSLGHGVGINIHELPRLSPRYPLKLQIGNVVTVEPGIYMPEKFGVRIEDMIYLSNKGAKNLTKTQKDLIII